MADPNAPFDNTKPPQSPTPEPGQPGEAPAGLVSAESADAKTMAMLAHLLGILTFFIGPLVIWLVKKDESKFVDQQGKEALNWGIMVSIALFGCGILMVFFFFTISFFAALMRLAQYGIIICNIVFGILSTIEVNKGLPYRYPFCIRIIK